jgi:hypothetical protein
MYPNKNASASRPTFLPLLLMGFVLIPLSAFAQVDVSPSELYKPPSEPSCFTITVAAGSYRFVYLQVYSPSGSENYWGRQLDENGQVNDCIDETWEEGQYVISAVYYDGWYYVPTYAPFMVYPAPPPPLPPVIFSEGSGCDNGECVWATGIRFQQDSRVLAYSADWAYSQTYYGPAWQRWPQLNVSSDGQSLSFYVADANLRSSFGWNGIYFIVLNSDGTYSDWRLVHSDPPRIDSGGAECADLYCIWLTGNFPPGATVAFRIPGQPDVLQNSYSNLSVSSSRITLRLNANTRYAYDTTGLNAWVVNTALPNWSGAYYLPPIDRAVIGNIDGITQNGSQYYVNGWACAKTYAGSIDIHVYRGGAAGAGGTFAFSGSANVASEPAVAAACHSSGSAYRFSVPIPDAVTINYGGQPIYVHGISPFGLGNPTLGHSGAFTIPAVDHSITGSLEGISPQGSSYYLYGWACAKTYAGSINVQAYVGAPAGSGGTLAFSGTANVASEPALQSLCNSTGLNYRFWLLIPPSVIQQYGGQPIYVHGISPFGLPNLAIANSGFFIVPGAPTGTIYWKKDYIKDPRGAALAAATPRPFDTTQPTVPGGVQCSNASSSSLTVSWTQSSDSGLGVAGYAVYRGVLPVGNVAYPATSFVDTVLQPQAGYAYRVVALDYAGNPSGFSSTVNCQTQ